MTKWNAIIKVLSQAKVDKSGSGMLLKLNAGDIIDVVAPSSAKLSVSPEAVGKFITSLGYQPRIRDNMTLQGADPFSANTDDVRYNQLLDAILAEDSKAIWAFGGGYGATRLIPLLEKHDFLLAQPKILIGFSDITALQLYFYKKYHWPYLHSRVLWQYILNNEIPADELNKVKDILSDEPKDIRYKLKPANSKAYEAGVLEAEVVGGNLSLLQCSLATNWQIDASDKILFIEEANERGYRVHRVLQHLKQARVFDNIKALIIGDISCNPEADGSYLCDNAIDDFIKDVNFPVFKTSLFGHGEKNYPLPCGIEAKLITGEAPFLIFENFE